MSAPAPSLSSQAIGQAEAALGAILEPLLDRAQLTFHQWLVLVITSARGGTVRRDELGRQLATMRKLSAGQVLAAVEALASAGLVSTGLVSTGLAATGLAATGLAAAAGSEDAISLTDAGRARYGAVREHVDAITGRIFGDLPAEDLAIAGRVLAVVTARAQAEVAAAEN